MSNCMGLLLPRLGGGPGGCLLLEQFSSARHFFAGLADLTKRKLKRMIAGKVAFFGLLDEAFRQFRGMRIAATHFGSQRKRFSLCRTFGDDSADQPERQGFGRLDGAAGKNYLGSASTANPPCQ